MPPRSFPAIFFFLLLITLWHAPVIQAREAEGPPPALVVVDQAESGTIAPTSRFVGTLYFVDVSDVSSETNGKVSAVHFTEGDRVQNGQKLVELTTDILEQQIISRRAQLEAAQTEHEKAVLDFERMKRLHESGTVSDEEYDTTLYRARELKDNIRSIQADVASLEIRLSKKTIRAPFNGVVLEKRVVLGEWVEPGGAAVAVLARDGMMEAVFNLPQDIFPHLQVGASMDITTPIGPVAGTLQPLILRGDMNTRTIPVKIRFRTDTLLAEGMAVQADFPTSQPHPAVLVPRDALINFQGRQVVFMVREGAAYPADVEVIGYIQDQVGLQSDSIALGTDIVIKGNERLRPGQPVQPIDD